MTETERKQIIALVQREVVRCYRMYRTHSCCFVCGESYRNLEHASRENRGSLERQYLEECDGGGHPQPE